MKIQIQKLKKAALIAFAFCAINSNAQSFNPLLAQMLQDTLNTFVGFIPSIKGMSASVYLPNQGMWQGVKGLSHTGVPITKEMEFGIASNSKLFTAAAMLILQENGVLDLDDSLSKWLPNYPNIDSNITIRQLLGHRSGVPDFFAGSWLDTVKNNPTRVFTPTEVVSWVGPSLFPAGSSFSYSNTNYVLTDMVVKSATGFSIYKTIRDEILTPLNMDSTFFDSEEPAVGTIAHRWWDGGTGAPSADYHAVSRTSLNSSIGAAGAIFSTSSEMAQWYHALFSGQVLNPNSMTELTTFLPTTSPTQQYGLGLFKETLQGLTFWGHGGETWGYRSRMMYDNCSGAVVCGLTNSFPNGMPSVPFVLLRVIKNHVPACPGAITGATTVCQGQNSVTYTVPQITNATSYEWTLPIGATGISNTNSITVNYGTSAVSGEITVKGNSIYGVGSSSSIAVNVNTVDLGVTVLNNVLTANQNGSSYQWLDCGNGNSPIVGETNQSYTPINNGSYAVSVTINGCSNVSACNNINSIGVSTLESPTNLLSTFPNPNNGKFTLKAVKEFNISIVNELGETVKVVKLNSKNNYTEQIENLDAGIYFIVGTNDTDLIKKKIVVSK